MLLMWNESDSAAVVVLWNERLLMLIFFIIVFQAAIFAHDVINVIMTCYAPKLPYDRLVDH